MRTTFGGLEIGLRALRAYQTALEVAAHNIANANTEGYSRQSVTLEASPPHGPAQAGTGVIVQGIRRLRDQFIDMQIRFQNGVMGGWKSKQQVLEEVEAIFNEPSEIGIRGALDSFWDALQELANQPESLAVRTNLKQRSLALVDSISHVQRQLGELRANANDLVAQKVSRVNHLAGQIASLNAQILKGGGGALNDLLDRRDKLLEELSSMVGIRVQATGKGVVTVFLAGGTLVDTYGARFLEARRDAGDGMYRVAWQGGVEVVPRGGELSGLLDARDRLIPGYQAQIEALWDNLRDEINAVHRSGFGLDGSTGVDFFDSSSSSPGLSRDVLQDVRKVAASLSGEAGDGSNALAMAGIKRKLLPAGHTLEDSYRSLVGSLGVDAQEASRMVEVQELLLEQLHRQRDSVSGVSLDEEMANLVRYQRSYEAAARLVTAMDELIDTIINRMGLAGR